MQRRVKNTETDAERRKRETAERKATEQVVRSAQSLLGKIQPVVTMIIAVVSNKHYNEVPETISKPVSTCHLKFSSWVEMAISKNAEYILHVGGHCCHPGSP